jgi:CheY-like chemotaxis protein
VLFDLLRHDPKTRGIPVHVISGASDMQSLLSKGAASVTTKPAAQEELTAVFRSIRAGNGRIQRKVLVADADPDQRLALVDAIRDGITLVSATASLAEAAEEHDLAAFDAVVIGLGRSAKANAHVLAEARRRDEEQRLRLVIFGSYGDAVDQAIQQHPFRGPVARADNLPQLAALLPSVLGDDIGSEAAPEVPEQADMADLVGAKVLIVDDDIRNIYSLTSVLETYSIEVLHAERGRDGISILEERPGVDVALIDIMMPEMDGYETMGEIRKRTALADLPLIAVTAKAMKGDRQKCLEAGASDYVAKPVDIDLLLALLRVWIRRSRSRPRPADLAMPAE